MKKYIQPSLKVKEIELAQLIANSPNGPSDEETNGTQLTNERRGWNLWGVED